MIKLYGMTVLALVCASSISFGQQPIKVGQQQRVVKPHSSHAYDEKDLAPQQIA